jgi:deoxyribodipyrimidine photo-lyase
MTGEEQRGARCVIGRDYPAPIVDHAREREVALRLLEEAR